MGIPYSKQINAAFDSVTPLVAEGFQVLQTTKNIALLAAGVQIFTAIILTFISLILIALLITMNPDLKEERDFLVTPVVKWAAQRVMGMRFYWRSALIGSLIVLLGCAIGAVAAVGFGSTDFVGMAEEEQRKEE